MGFELLKFEMYQSRVQGLKFTSEHGKWTGKEPALSAAQPSSSLDYKWWSLQIASNRKMPLKGAQTSLEAIKQPR